MTHARVCLVTPGQLSINPRLVKEADALHEAGYEVTVVATDIIPDLRKWDQEIASRGGWKYRSVTRGSLAGHITRTAVHRVARGAAKLGWNPDLRGAAWAHGRMTFRLAHEVDQVEADLYIARYLPALPATAWAAEKRGAALGFDAEDFHTGELTDQPNPESEVRIRETIERTLLPRCVHLTAASPMIAEAYCERYGLEMLPLLNVFPLAEAPNGPKLDDGERQSDEPSLYWFSQTVGPGRGLEAVIRAMALMRTRVHLHLRGRPRTGYVQRLLTLAHGVGVGDRVHFLDPAAPWEMSRLAAQHDVGLAVELNEPFHHTVCLANKIFVYLLAGIPVLLSRTPAQEALARDLGEAARLVDLERIDEVALELDDLLSDPGTLARARAQSWRLGQERYNWDVEKRRFLESVETALA